MDPRESETQTRVRISLPNDATAPMVARKSLRILLGGWSLPTLVEPVLLAASELVTNAFRHGLPPVCLTVRRSASRMSVGVSDASAVEPHTPGASTESLSGRGMSIVQQVSSDSGSRITGPGKVVWAEFEIPGDHTDEADRLPSP